MPGTAPHNPSGMQKVIRSDASRDDAAQLPRVAVPAGKMATAPKVELVQDNGVIQAIEITCSCGQNVRLLCQYD